MIAALEGSEWSPARPGRTLPLGKTQYPFTGGWVGPRAGLEGRKISSPPGFDPGPSSPQLVAISTELPGPHKPQVMCSNLRDKCMQIFIRSGQAMCKLLMFLRQGEWRWQKVRWDFRCRLIRPHGFWTTKILLSSAFRLDLVIPPPSLPIWRFISNVSCRTQKAEPFHLLEHHSYVAKALLSYPSENIARFIHSQPKLETAGWRPAL